MRIIYSPKFVRNYTKLPLEVKKLAEKQEKIFRADPFDHRLKTHKLKGKFRDFWSFSIDYSYRIVFEFSKDKSTVYFHATGDHKVYK